ncbi:MAG: S46 family peptidase [Bacteroidales bacterium]|nr:S46 family peptidase [Bacteroidales bacterium]
MKRIFLTLVASVMFAGNVRAEGMWIPLLLQKNEKEMQEMGMRISADDIYSMNHSSMKDAVVLFGGGCTGELVSDQGLLLTNHHCGYGWIQRHSTVEHDYLTDGFWAMTQQEELACPGLTAVMMKEMRDVTEKILYNVTREMTETQRDSTVTANVKRLTELLQKETEYEVTIEPFYEGNQFFAIYNEVFKDIRMVGAPPSNIGKFGGDTDNWVWPRHTGDFSIFRIYVSPEGKPVEYDNANVPYKPDYHFTISLKGANENDFTFVFGYPARTTEYLPSVAVNQEANVVYPVIVDLRGQILDIYNKYQEKDPKVRIQYASKHAGLGNGWKKWMGVTEGIRSFHGVEKKQAFEESFMEWCYKSRSRAPYMNLLKNFNEVYGDFEKYRMAYTYFTEAGLSIELIEFAANFRELAKVTKDTPKEDVEEIINELRNSSKSFFKDYYQPIDEEVASAMLTAYRAAQPADFRPALLNDIDSKYKGDVWAYVDYLFGKTMFVSEEKVNSLLDNFKVSDAKKIAKDPAVLAFEDMLSFYRENVRDNYVACNRQIKSLRRVYMEGQMKMIPEVFPERNMYPDANFTLRVTYGKVGGFKPKDGVNYRHFTTLDGIMQKENPDIYDYVVTDRLRELYEAKDYGRYADADGTMHVAFIAGNHTTGGNSGSPILNADGHLLGLNFDRTWEGTMSDLIYDPSICKNISVDIRYVLFLIDKYAGCTRLIDEMNITTN